MLLTDTKHSNRSLNRTRTRTKSFGLMILILFSVFAHLDFTAPEKLRTNESNPLNSGVLEGYTRSPIVISGSTNVSFILGEQPYRWFSFEGYQSLTYQYYI